MNGAKIVVFAVNSKYLNKNSRSCFLRLLTNMKLKYDDAQIALYALNGTVPPFSISQGVNLAVKKQKASHLLFIQSYTVFDETLYDEMAARNHPAVFSPSWGRNMMSLRRGTMKYEAVLLRVDECMKAVNKIIKNKTTTLSDVYREVVESGIEPYITIPPVANLHSYEKFRKGAVNAYANDKLSA